MPIEKRRDSDRAAVVDDALSIKKKPRDYARPLIVLLVVLAVGLGLIVCIVSAVSLGFFAFNNDSTASKLPGSWKGQFIFAGRHLDSTYTFRRDGTLQEVNLDGFGRRNVANGKWRVQNGQVHIDWNNGGIEVATVHWIDERTMDYHIIEHTELAQIGIGTTFKKQ